MEKYMFLGNKWLMRIRLTMSQIKEWVYLGKKRFMRMWKLVTPPKMEECARERETGPHVG